MRANTAAALALAAFALAATAAVFVSSGRSPARPARIDRFDAPDLAVRFAQERRAPLRDGINVAEAYARAADWRERLPRYSSRIGRELPAALAPASVWTSGGRVVANGARVSPTAILDAWTPLGPGNIGGRTRVIRYHPTIHTTIFAAGVLGGVWRSDDDGGSWRPIADGLANLSVNALAIDPRRPDVMFAGTGEGYFREEIRGTGLPLRGSGIFATSDGGATWRRLPGTTTDDFLWVNDLELGVGDSRRIYAATRTGVWRSLDSGQTWSAILTTTVRGGCLDLAMRPDRADDALFASCGSYEQATVYRIDGASGDPRPEAVLSEPDMGRTSLAIAPSNPDVMYALAASNAPGPGGAYQQGLLAVFRSDRGGASGSWQARVRNTDPVRFHTLLLTNASPALVRDCVSSTNATNTIINMGWYNNVIAVDPRDPERVWAAGVDWFRSDDGARTWGRASRTLGPPESATGSHVDQHAIVFHPDYDAGANQTAIIGNDGGLARTANARARITIGAAGACEAADALAIRWESLNHDYGVTQFYYGQPLPDGERYFGGAQDNSTPIGSDERGLNAWQTFFGGDGGYVAVNPSNTQQIYVASQTANVARSVNGGTNFSSAITGLDPPQIDYYGPDSNYLFVTPFVMDPSNVVRLWLGGRFLYRTANGAQAWTKASTAMPDDGLVSTIAIAPTDPNRVVAGTHRGHIVSTRAALAATSSTEWEAKRPREGWVTSVAIDRNQTRTMYATYGNFGGPHVYRSTDDGATWTARDGSGAQALPDIPVHCLAVDPDTPARLYLGTDAGVFVSIDAGATWMVEETGFGPAVTEWLAIVRDTSGRKRLFAFTHGRGVWRVDLR